VLIGNPQFGLDENRQRAAVRSLQKTEEPKLLRASAGSALRSSEQRAGALEPLPGTQAELDAIHDLIKRQNWQVEVYTQERALEEAVKRVQSPRVVHLATHGFFLPDQEPPQRGLPGDAPPAREEPMVRSGLYFAGANRTLAGPVSPGGLEDGVLTAYEAMGLNLQGTELVVLSACQTGLGRVKNGEGVFGLRRALQVAGAEAVLMSLWSVPDQETQELMTLFYKKWLSGKSKHEALRESQLELRAKVKQRYGQDLPFYWGAFILVGR
jgi:CHAT domain-containing protein